MHNSPNHIRKICTVVVSSNLLFSLIILIKLIILHSAYWKVYTYVLTYITIRVTFMHSLNFQVWL